MEQIFGLPAHPLLIHFPVVSIPALCMAALVMAVSPKVRRLLGIPAVLLGGASLVSTFLATQSGNALTDRLVDDFFLSESQIEKHRDLGQTTLWLVALLFVFLCVQLAVGRSLDAKVAASVEAPAAAQPGLMVLGAVVALLAVLSTVWVVRTGHEGAKVVWGSLSDSDEDALVDVVPADDPPETAVAAPAATTAPEPTAVPATLVPATTVPATPVPATPVPEPATAAAEPATEEPIPVEPDGGIGDSPGVDALAVYSTACANCHGDEGQGTQRGRPLTAIAATKTFEEHLVSVADGIGNMPAFGDRLSPEELDAVVTYVRETF